MTTTTMLTPEEMISTVRNNIETIIQESEGEMADSWILLHPSIEPNGSVTSWVTFDGPDCRDTTDVLLFAGSCTREDVEREIARYAQEHGVEVPERN